MIDSSDDPARARDDLARTYDDLIAQTRVSWWLFLPFTRIKNSVNNKWWGRSGGRASRPKRRRRAQRSSQARAPGASADPPSAPKPAPTASSFRLQHPPAQLRQWTVPAILACIAAVLVARLLGDRAGRFPQEFGDWTICELVPVLVAVLVYRGLRLATMGILIFIGHLSPLGHLILKILGP